MQDKSTSILHSLVRLMFPSDMLDYFEVVDFDEGTEHVSIYLEEKDNIQNGKPGHVYERNGFLPASRITDFPLRDKRVTLVVKRRRWKDVDTGESISNDYELVAKGTRHSQEFAAFLKEVLGQIPDSGFFS